MAEIMLSDRDLRHLNEVLVGPVEHDLDGPLPRSMLHALRELIQCDWIGVWEQAAQTRQHLRALELPECVTVLGPCEPHPIHDYFRRPGTARHAIRLSDLFPSQRALRQTQAWFELFRPNNAADSLEIVLPAPTGVVARVGLDRSRGCFTDRDRVVLQLLRPRIAEVYLQGLAGPSRTTSLTSQERGVLRHVASGLSNQEIAWEMSVAVSTVRKHLEHIFLKLDVASRSAAVATAFPHVVAAIEVEA